MNTLITGASGYVGSHLAKALRGKGHEVRAFVRQNGRSSAKKELQAIGCEIFEGDIRDASSVDRAVEGVEVVYHIAALFRQAAVSDKDYYTVHVEGTRNVMESCLKHKISRVVHCSTVGVHGDVENPPADEKAPFNPGDMYQQTKLEGEEVALSFYKAQGLPVSIIRPAMIYGPGDLRWLKFIRMAQARLTFVPGGGGHKLHLVHIDDLVSAFLLASEKPEAIGEVFIIAGEKDIRLKDLLDLVARQSNKSVHRIHLPYEPLYVLSAICEKLFVPLKIEPPLYRRRLAFFKNCRSFNIEKARRVLGYAPTVLLEDGFKGCASWFRKEGMINGRE